MLDATYEVGGDSDGHLVGRGGKGAGDGGGRSTSSNDREGRVPEKSLSKSCARTTGSHGRQEGLDGGGGRKVVERRCFEDTNVI